MSLVSVRRRVGWAQPPPGGLVSSAARGRRVVLRRVAEAATPHRAIALVAVEAPITVVEEAVLLMAVAAAVRRTRATNLLNV